ncbi:hypothetical protein HYX12_02840 [Candidatus Woesearchaeota archaeon]|nr:hypothetical protein [Candidatus Woesearchaeota archaeon]
MNKKALVLRNTLELIFVVLSLAVLISCGAQILNVIQGTSDQGDKNFAEFLNDIKTFKSDQSQSVGATAGTRVFLEDGKGIIYFEPFKVKMSLAVNYASDSLAFIVDFQRPASCGPEKSCLCLIKEKKYESTVSSNIRNFNVELTKVKCVQDIDLRLEKCAIGKDNILSYLDTVSTAGEGFYTCTDGFLIERLLVKELAESEHIPSAYFEAPQHLALTLTKEENAISLAPQ